MKLLGILFLIGGTMALVPSVDDYWPYVADDLSQVTWAHATNSKALLTEAVTNPKIMMIEADILMGRVGNGSIEPIMAHPPHNTSDLSFKEFIAHVISAVEHNHVKKGIKLDFKELEAVTPCLDILSRVINQIDFPVWLNADILPGPVNSPNKPLNASQFLEKGKNFLPDVTLSIGWTTKYTFADDPNGIYSLQNCAEMVDAIQESSVQQAITFPVRAAFVKNSLFHLTWLVDKVEDSTLTVWSSASDDVDIDSLLDLQDTAGPDVVFFDLPKDQRAEFDRKRQFHRSSANKIWPQALYFTTAVAIIACGFAAINIWGGEV